MKRRLLTSLAIIFLVTVQACTGNGGPKPSPEANKGTSISENTSESATQPAASVVVATPTPEYVKPEDIAMGAVIDTTPEVVGAGKSVSFASNIPLTATLKITGPKGTALQADLQSGKAQLTIPEGTPAGVYTVLASSGEKSIAVGSFRIADKPGIWLETDRAFVRPGETATIKVMSWGYPNNTPVQVEVHGAVFSTNELSPDTQTGQLILASFDKPALLGDLIKGTWPLPKGMVGGVDVTVLNETNSDGSNVTSNTVEVKACSAASYIKGNLGQAGQVRAVWKEGQIQTTTAVTQDGSFEIQAGPGLVLLDVQRTGSSLSLDQSSQAVRLGCGETADVGSANLDLKTSIQQAYPFLGLTIDDLNKYNATATGDVTFDHKGLAECDMTDGTLTIKLDPGLDIPMSYTLKAPGVDGDGKYQAVFDLMDVTKGEATGSGTIDIVTDKIDQMMGVKGTFTANYDGDLGTGQVSGNFSCFYVPPMAQASSMDKKVIAPDFGGNKPLTALSPVVLEAGASQNTCRKGFIAYPQDKVSPILGEILGSTLFKTDPRLSVLTIGDVRALLGLQAERMLLGADDSDVQSVLAAIGGSLGVDFSFFLKIYQVGSKYVLDISVIRIRDARVIIRAFRSGTDLEKVAISDIYQQIADKMKNAAICGKIDPTEKTLNHGGTANISFTTTDLAGSEVNDAQVASSTSTCGKLNPDHGQTSGGSFQTKFTANQGNKPCDETLVFKASANTPAGEVETKPEEGQIKLSVADQWRLDMQLSVESGQDKFTINWHGFFHVNSDGKLIGTGNGDIQGNFPDYPCLILDFDHGNIHTEPNSAALNGNFNFYIYGDASGQSDQASFNLDPLGASAKLTYTFGNQKCAQGATYDPITGTLISMAAQEPLFMMGLKQLVLESKDGATVTKTSTSGVPGTMTATLHRDNGNSS